MKFSVKELAALAGVTVRTLHLYDQRGLLCPSRTEAGYRTYGEAELFRLQQILFYKALGFSLKEIADVLDDPGFELISALESHKEALELKRQHISEMLKTIDKTVLTLKKEHKMSNYEELYKGISRETAAAYRKGAIEKYGAETVQTAENYLGKLSKEEIQQLKEEQKDIINCLNELIAENPASEKVQKEIGRHYLNIRQFWGTSAHEDPQLEAYKGLGDLYVSDDRFIQTHGKSNPVLARFMRDAMQCFAARREK